MTTLTTNQTAALELFYAKVPESDFDNHNYFSMIELINILVRNGWERKSAEGTIGSLLVSDEVNFYEEEVDGGYLIYTLWIPETHPSYEEV